jgi:hypothetical protein
VSSETSEVGIEGGVGIGEESKLEDTTLPLSDAAIGRVTGAGARAETSKDDGVGPSTRRAGSRMVRRPGEADKGQTSV